MKEQFRNLKIGTKLVLAFCVVILLYAVTAVAAVVNIRRMSDRMQKLYDEPFANVETSMKMIANLQSVGRNITILSTTDGVVDEAAYIQETKDLIAQEEKEMNTLLKGNLGSSENLANLKTQFESLSDPREQILHCLSEDRKEDALSIYLEQYAPQSQTVKEALNKVIDEAVLDAEYSLQKGKDTNGSVSVLMVVLTVVIAGITVFLCIVISKSILMPIREIKKSANGIANGQLNLKPDYTSRNELGELAEDVRNTADALKSYVWEIQKGMTALGHGKLTYRSEMDFKGDFVGLGKALEEIAGLLRGAIEQIGSSAEQVYGGAEQVSNGAQSLAHSASEQAGAVEELAVSMNEIADSVQDNAENAARSSELARLVGSGLTESDRRMSELLEYIGQMKRNSGEVAGIAKEIEDIAFQTNILALNASVEAARAGEAGRGFSVVAGEVRRLAAKTSAAAELIEKNSLTVDEGVEAVHETAKVLKDSVGGARKVAEMVDAISEVSAQQSESVDQIRQNMDQISEIVQGNSAMSQESAAASEELSAQAQILKELVEQFEI